MPKVKDVKKKYHKIVPFPWTGEKIREYGQDPESFLADFFKDFAACEDAEYKSIRQLLRFLEELEMTL